jgi:hypothetical protein
MKPVGPEYAGKSKGDQFVYVGIGFVFFSVAIFPIFWKKSPIK